MLIYFSSLRYNTHMKNIEIEHRALLTEDQYNNLLAYLSEHATDLGADDKQVYFFLMPDKLLKVSHNISKQSGKITLKLNRIGQGSAFEEIEFPIAAEDVTKAVNLFKLLGHEYLVEPTIRRRNYVYNGVEFAVKYSKSWGYHAELEIVIDDPKHQAAADSQIHSVASELGLTLMTDEEQAAFTKNVEQNYVHPQGF